MAIPLFLTLTVSGQERNVFGEKKLSEAALMGIFYDLKQTQEGKPTNMGASQYWAVKAGEVYDLDVLVGERPGGEFYAFLMVEKQGETYEMADGNPVLPIFQVAPYDTPEVEQYRAPRFAKGGKVWRSHQ